MHRARWNSDYMQIYQSQFCNESRFRSERSPYAHMLHMHFSDFVAAARRLIAQDRSIDLTEVTKARGSRYLHSLAGHALKTCLNYEEFRGDDY